MIYNCSDNEHTYKFNIEKHILGLFQSFFCFLKDPLTLLGKLIQKFIELSYQLVYIKWSFTAIKVPPREM